MVWVTYPFCFFLDWSGILARFGLFEINIGSWDVDRWEDSTNFFWSLLFSTWGGLHCLRLKRSVWNFESKGIKVWKSPTSWASSTGTGSSLGAGPSSSTTCNTELASHPKTWNTRGEFSLNGGQVPWNSTLQRVRKCILPLFPLGQAQVRARARAGKDQLKLGA